MKFIFFNFLWYKLSKAKDRCYDKILGVETTYLNPVGNINPNDDMAPYQPTPYGRLEKILAHLSLNPEDIFVDLGCGKGRAVFFMALKRLKKVIGVEWDEQLLDTARKNLNNLRINRTPIEFINCDAADFVMSDETIFFMFNPFGKFTLERVVNNIKESLVLKPRKIRILYYAPVHRDVLDCQDWLVLEGGIGGKNCLVWSNKEVKQKVD